MLFYIGHFLLNIPKVGAMGRISRKRSISKSAHQGKGSDQADTSTPLEKLRKTEEKLSQSFTEAEVGVGDTVSIAHGEDFKKKSSVLPKFQSRKGSKQALDGRSNKQQEDAALGTGQVSEPREGGDGSANVTTVDKESVPTDYGGNHSADKAEGCRPNDDGASSKDKAEVSGPPDDGNHSKDNTDRSEPADDGTHSMAKVEGSGPDDGNHTADNTNKCEPADDGIRSKVEGSGPADDGNHSTDNTNKCEPADDGIRSKVEGSGPDDDGNHSKVEGSGPADDGNHSKVEGSGLADDGNHSTDNTNRSEPADDGIVKSGESAVGEPETLVPGTDNKNTKNEVASAVSTRAENDCQGAEIQEGLFVDDPTASKEGEHRTFADVPASAHSNVVTQIDDSGFDDEILQTKVSICEDTRARTLGHLERESSSTEPENKEKTPEEPTPTQEHPATDHGTTKTEINEDKTIKFDEPATPSNEHGRTDDQTTTAHTCDTNRKEICEKHAEEELPSDPATESSASSDLGLLENPVATNNDALCDKKENSQNIDDCEVTKDQMGEKRNIEESVGTTILGDVKSEENYSKIQKSKQSSTDSQVANTEPERDDVQTQPILPSCTLIPSPISPSTTLSGVTVKTSLSPEGSQNQGAASFSGVTVKAASSPALSGCPEVPMDDEDITDSQLCSVDWDAETVGPPPSIISNTTRVVPPGPRGKQPSPPADGSKVIHGLIKELTTINQTLLKTQREMEVARKHNDARPHTQLH